MTAPNEPAPPAGWYPSPSGPDQSRWWNGSVWTENVQPFQHAVETPLTMSPGVYQGHIAQPRITSAVGHNPYYPERLRVAGTNTLANSSLISGLVSWGFNPSMLIGVGAVIVGIVGLSRARAWARDDFEPVGRLQAISGIVLGSGVTLFDVVVNWLLF